MKGQILISNDDGIRESGIFHLVKALLPHYEITVVAPSCQQSGKGLGITLHTPLRIQKVDFGLPVAAYEVNGTPADCIKMALSKILNNKPILIVSGINPGDNSGRNALYSGTVGATIEGSLRGIPGIAFSCLDFENPPFESFSSYIPNICDYFLNNPIPQGTIINVNCPSKELGSIQGVKLATQGRGYWCEDAETIQNSPSFDYDHYLGASWQEHPELDTSDVYLLKKGFITAVPIKISELTDQNHFESEAKRFESAINPLQSFLI